MPHGAAIPERAVHGRQMATNAKKKPTKVARLLIQKRNSGAGPKSSCSHARACSSSMEHRPTAQMVKCYYSPTRTLCAWPPCKQMAACVVVTVGASHVGTHTAHGMHCQMGRSAVQCMRPQQRSIVLVLAAMRTARTACPITMGVHRRHRRPGSRCRCRCCRAPAPRPGRGPPPTCATRPAPR